MTTPGPYDYDPEDFGADDITYNPNWRGSGYDHYSAWSSGGGQISWDVDPYGNYLDDSIHISDRNIPNGYDNYGGG